MRIAYRIILASKVGAALYKTLLSAVLIYELIKWRIRKPKS